MYRFLICVCFFVLGPAWGYSHSEVPQDFHYTVDFYDLDQDVDSWEHMENSISDISKKNYCLVNPKSLKTKEQEIIGNLFVNEPEQIEFLSVNVAEKNFFDCDILMQVAEHDVKILYENFMDGDYKAIEEILKERIERMRESNIAIPGPSLVEDEE